VTRLRTWECRCGAVNLESHGECEACGKAKPEGVQAQPQQPTPTASPRPRDEPPCTYEQSQQAMAIVRAVVAGQLTAEEADRRIAEIIPGAA
jgi:hypothetical protein